MNRYDNLDGLRSFAAVGIVLMHIMTNTKFQLPENVLINIIGMAGLLVQLFFMISGFSMCCGYYERIKEGKISLDTFYKKRYLKILPFFAFLVCIDIVVSGGGVSYLIEGFSDATLMYGLFPNSDIQVIGVGWALGVIFAFYLLFPFYVFMLWNKKRGWFFLAVTTIIYYCCIYYFGGTDCNIAKWLCYFILGGIIYLHRDGIKRVVTKNRYISLGAVAVISVMWYISPNNIYSFNISALKLMILFSAWMCYAISVRSKILSNKVTKFMSGISFEIYLSHMVIFRVIDTLRIPYIAGTGFFLSYIVTSFVVLICVTVFAAVMKNIINKFIEYLRGKSYGRKEA